MAHLNLSVNDVPTTTRAVRKRFDLTTRPAEQEVIKECIALAQEAPTGGNLALKQFVAVTDPDQRLAFAEIYRRAYRDFVPDADTGLAR